MKRVLMVMVAFAGALASAADEYTELLSKLVTIRSNSEYIEGVNQAVEYMKGWLEDRGLSCEMHEMPNGRKTLWASTKPGKVQDYILCPHLDTVPASRPEQYQPRVDGDLIYGRGTCDNKANCAMCAMVLAKLAGKASVGAIFTTDEEIGGTTTGHWVENGYKARKMAYVLDGCKYVIITAQKGQSYFKLKAKGRGGHSSQPWNADNPLPKLFAAWNAISQAWDRTHTAKATNEDNWHEVLVPTIVHAGDVGNHIPDEAEMTINLRTVTPEGHDDTLKMIREAIGGIDGVSVEGIRQVPPIVIKNGDREFERFATAVKAAFPEEAFPRITINGATDAARFADMGVPVAITGCWGDGEHAYPEFGRISSGKRFIEFFAKHLAQ